MVDGGGVDALAEGAVGGAVLVMSGDPPVRHDQHAGADDAVARGVGVEGSGEGGPTRGTLDGDRESQAREGLEHGDQTYSGQARLDLPAAFSIRYSGRQSVESFWLC